MKIELSKYEASIISFVLGIYIVEHKDTDNISKLSVVIDKLTKAARDES